MASIPNILIWNGTSWQPWAPVVVGSPGPFKWYAVKYSSNGTTWT